MHPGRLVCLGLLGAAWFAQPLHAATERSIELSSTPQGAQVCKRTGRKEQCYGTTPVSVDVSFSTADESKRYSLHKLGYRSAEALLSIESAKVDIKLEKQDLFLDPGQHESASLRRTQDEVNRRLAKTVYSYRGPADNKLQASGKFGLVQTREGSARLKFSVLINSQQVLKDLKRASRTRNESRRYRKVMDVMRKHGVFDYYDMIAASLRGLPIDALEYEVIYSQSQAVLDFDQVQDIAQRWTGSYYTGYGDVVQRVDTYEVYSVSRDVTVVKDRQMTTEYTFLSDLNQPGNSAKTGLFDELDETVIYTNDNRKSRVERIQMDPR